MDAGPSDNFGFSVGINGDTIVAGSYQDDSATATDAGSAYIFVRVAGVWTQQQKLSASDAAEGDFFGNAVAISGNTVVIGAFFDDTARGDSAGSAYAFTRNGTVWTEQQHLAASDGAAIDDFGYAVAVGGNTIIVGAIAGDTPGGISSGTAYVYTRNNNIWTEQQELIPFDGGAPEDFFGSSVAISGNTALVGEFFDDLNPIANAGSAYIFTTPSVNISGRVITPSGLPLRNATVSMTDRSNVKRTTTTSSFGIYTFDNVIIGETYTVSVVSKRFRFSPQILQFTTSVTNVDFVGLE
ncbi:MAG: carboxypeptidase regulatory-like domain-containing protein [Pyrinomonadaceae bacterium]